jgi:hypothetical protein
MDYAVNNSHWDQVEKLRSVEDLIYDDGPQPGPPHSLNVSGNTVVSDLDPRSGGPTLRINVQHMVEAYVGPGWIVHVEQETWYTGGMVYAGNITGIVDPYVQLAIHLCKQEDNPNVEVITIRETFGKFPSQELRTKLELLRYK